MARDDPYSGEERLWPVGDLHPNDVAAVLQFVHLGRAELEAVDSGVQAAGEVSCGETARGRPDQRDVKAAAPANAKHEIDRPDSSVMVNDGGEPK
jgi:hypothetical protein